MERWDFDCQKCGRNIGDYAYVDSEWYQCSQDKHRYEMLEKVYPITHFSLQDGFIVLEDDNIPQKIAEKIKFRITEILKRAKKGEKYKTHKIFDSNLITKIFLEESKVKWHLSDKEDEYYQQAGIIKHKISGRGWGRLGYTFDSRCAKELGYKCDICGSDLEKVVADQHPGGHWGIRGIREPAPLR